jgi:ketosteroid isomerase-like protein
MNRSIFCLCLATLLLTRFSLPQSAPANTMTEAPDCPPTKALVIAGQNASLVEATIRELEQQVDAAVFSGDVRFLQSVYADDFRFTHGTGKVQNKAEWLEDVGRRPFVSRKLHVLDVEIHGNVAVTYGRLDVTWREGQSVSLNYVRVYQQRNGHWQMLMHRAVEETSR